MEQKDGGPAFPIADPFTAHQPSTTDDAKRLAEGMSLRDYLAAKAMALVDANDAASVGAVCAALNIAPADYRWLEHWPQYVANQAYAYADAMLAARQGASNG